VICEQCRENEASLHLVTYLNGEKIEKHICSDCAAQMNAPGVFNAFSIGDLFNSFFKSTQAETAELPSLRCPDCGMSIGDFKSTGQFGCAGCYKAFEEYIIPLIKKVQGGTEHTGKAPEGMSKKFEKRRQIDKLKEMISDAVRAEDYEHAAGLRDKIKALEKEED
jgi:protein arginine kinase activator